MLGCYHFVVLPVFIRTTFSIMMSSDPSWVKVRVTVSEGSNILIRYFH